MTVPHGSENTNHLEAAIRAAIEMGLDHPDALEVLHASLRAPSVEGAERAGSENTETLAATPDDWHQEVQKAASTLVQHTYSGDMALNGVKRDDLLAVRREDWDKLFKLLSPR